MDLIQSIVLLLMTTPLVVLKALDIKNGATSRKVKYCYCGMYADNLSATCFNVPRNNFQSYKTYQSLVTSHKLLISQFTAFMIRHLIINTSLTQFYPTGELIDIYNFSLTSIASQCFLFQRIFIPTKIRHDKQHDVLSRQFFHPLWLERCRERV